MMSRWGDDDHQADEQTSRKPSPGDEITERLKRLTREAKEAELERRLREEKGSPGRRKGKG
jgi:hypothetical protein